MVLDELLLQGHTHPHDQDSCAGFADQLSAFWRFGGVKVSVRRSANLESGMAFSQSLGHGFDDGWLGTEKVHAEAFVGRKRTELFDELYARDPFWKGMLPLKP